MTFKQHIIYICFALFFLGNFWSQPTYGQQYFVRDFGIKEGLPCVEVSDVIQSSDRYLWLATCSGLMRFDGTQFTLFDVNDNRSQLTKRIFEDSKGRIWAGRWNASPYYYFEGNTYALQDTINNLDKNVGAFAETADGTVWIFAQKAIYKFQDQKFQLVYRTKYKDDYALGNGAIVAKDGKIWIATLGRGLAILDPKTEIIEMMNSKSHGINNICYSLMNGTHGDIWVGAYGVIYRYADSTFTQHTIGKGGSLNRVWSILQVDSITLGLALYGNGIAYYNTQTKEEVIIGVNQGLNDNYSYKLIQDVEGDNWIASQGGGLEKFYGLAIERYTKQEGLPSSNIMDIAFMADSTVILATQRGVVTLKNGKVLQTWLEGEYINSVKVFSGNKVWYTSSKHYGQLGEVQKLNPPKELFNDICYDTAKSQIILSGLSRLRLESHTKTTDIKFKDLEAQRMVQTNNELLILTYKGLYTWNGEIISKIKGLGERYYFSDVRLGENQFLLASSNEITVLKKVDNKWVYKHFPSSFFKLKEQFKAIERDENTLWIATNHQLLSIDLRKMLHDSTLKSTTHSRFTEVMTGQVNMGVMKLFGKILYVGTSDGLLVFKPGFNQNNEIEPILHLSVFEFFSGTRFEASKTIDSVISFPYNSNRLVFDMKSTSLSLPENIQYSYQVLGLDEVWSEPSFDNKVSFAHLPPGQYTFRFKANNGMETWATSPLVWAFSISPPFWQTNWFLFWMMILVILTISTLIFLRERKAYLLAQTQQRFTQAIWDGQETERKRIAKELHDGLGQNMLVLKNAMVSGLDTEKSLQLIDENIETVRSISRVLHPFVLEKFGVSKAIESLVDTMNEVQEIIFFSTEVDEIDQVLSKEMELNLYRIIQEAVSNIVKHSKATAGKITVKRAENEILIVIRDNGQGFSWKNKQEAINTFGLKSMSERAKLLNAQINFVNERGVGAVIELTIPSP